MIPRTALKYCKEGEISKIENYSLALQDTSQIWVIHHRLETHYYNDGVWTLLDEEKSVSDLKKDGLYYDRPSRELIFLTAAEHMALHNVWKKRKSKTNSGTWQKGNIPWNSGLKYDEARRLTNSFVAKQRKVLCIETGEVFDSVSEANISLGRRANDSRITQVCKGKRNTTGGYHWTYV